MFIFILSCFCFSSSRRHLVEQFACICLYTGSTCLKQFASSGTNIELICCSGESNLLLYNAEWNLFLWILSLSHFQTHYSFAMQLCLNPSLPYKAQQLDPVLSPTPIATFNLSGFLADFEIWVSEECGFALSMPLNLDVI
ncbi:hypothetical protein VNO78_23187 [Psophocarpus tetragonolobus]|uniref:Uncharacterized protein n=1 Tax=Psophocarpus tetragonolobus TaxID=3891 RepID=A0AAN9S3J5_PSOTE